MSVLKIFKKNHRFFYWKMNASLNFSAAFKAGVRKLTT